MVPVLSDQVGDGDDAAMQRRTRFIYMFSHILMRTEFEGRVCHSGREDGDDGDGQEPDGMS